jgi:hypothetical protein
LGGLGRRRAGYLPLLRLARHFDASYSTWILVGPEEIAYLGMNVYPLHEVLGSISAFKGVRGSVVVFDSVSLKEFPGHQMYRVSQCIRKDTFS